MFCNLVTMHECALEFTEYALILLYVIEFTFLAPLNFATRLTARSAYYRKTARKTWILFLPDSNYICNLCAYRWGIGIKERNQNWTQFQSTDLNCLSTALRFPMPPLPFCSHFIKLNLKPLKWNCRPCHLNTPLRTYLKQATWNYVHKEKNF